MFENITPAVKSIIILNIAMYVGTVFIAPQLYETMALWFFKNPNFQPWQIFTHMFMHDARGFTHILFNMYGLLIFGPALENWMGTNKFWFFYLSSGLGAVLLTFGIDYFQYMEIVNELQTQYPQESLTEINKAIFSRTIAGAPAGMLVGASGCLFGVLAGFAYLYPNVKLYLLFVPFGIAAKWLIGAYVLYETASVLGFIRLQDNVGHAAHLGGAIVGFVMVYYWKRNYMDKHRIY